MSTQLVVANKNTQFVPSTHEHHHAHQSQQSHQSHQETYRDVVMPHPEYPEQHTANTNGMLPFMAAVLFSPLVIAALTIPTFVIVPFMVKQVKPEWSYGKRVVVGVGATTVLGLTRQLIKKL